MLLCSSLCQGKWWIDRAPIKMTTPTDAKLVPVGVELIERGKKKHMFITELAIKELSLKVKIIFIHHLETCSKIKRHVFKNLDFGGH